jgi:hypothetical protein
VTVTLWLFWKAFHNGQLPALATELEHRAAGGKFNALNMTT